MIMDNNNWLKLIVDEEILFDAQIQSIFTQSRKISQRENVN